MNKPRYGIILFTGIRWIATWLLLGWIMTAARESFGAHERWGGAWVAAAFVLGCFTTTVGQLTREYRRNTTC